MSFRGIQVYSEHYARGAAKISGITSENAVDADAPFDFLIDDRTTTLFRFTDAETDHALYFDMGASFTGKIDTLIIPAGHNLDGVDIDVKADATTLPTTSRGSWTQSGNGVIKETLTDSGTSFRYWTIEFNTEGVHTLSQVIFALQKTFSSLNKVRDEDDFPQHAFTRFEQPSGITPTIQNGIPRRVINNVFEHALSGTNLATANNWINDVGMHRPFWMDPQSTSATPDADDPVTPFKFVNDPRRRWGPGAPARGVDRKIFDFNMIQSVD